jgi:hypothetical protein
VKRYRVEIAGRIPIYGSYWVTATSADEAMNIAEQEAVADPREVEWFFPEYQHLPILVSDVQHNGHIIREVDL